MSKTQELRISDIYKELAELREEFGRINIRVLVGDEASPTPIPPTAQASNQLRNGSFAHSVGSWANVATADDRRYECKYWFSHPNTTSYPMHYWETGNTGAKTFVDGNVTVGTDNIAITGHGYETADVIRLTTTGVLPAGLALATDYFIIKVDADNIKLASSLTNAYASTAVDITAAAGGGTHTVTPKNFTLKGDDHASYSSSQSNWTRNDTPAGVARMNQGYSLCAPLAQPSAEPAYTMFAVFNCAKANRYVYAPEGARITCGLYARQNGTWNYLQGDFTVTTSTSGTISTPTSRDYVIHTRTDRGFTIQSTAATVASAPSDTDFSAGARVVLSWQKPLLFGVIGYDIYRKTAKTFVDANVTVGTDSIAITNHTFATTDPVILTTTGVLPAGLSLATTYYVIRTDANNIKLASSAANATAGTAVDITGAAGGGTHTVSSFKLLDVVDTGLTSYIDNNSYRNTVVTAYPSSDFTKLVAYNASLNNVLANIATDGVDATWDTLPFALRVPSTYNHGQTDFNRFQWVVWNITGLTSDRFDVRVTDGVISGLSVTSVSAQFNAGMVGKNCIVTNPKTELTDSFIIDTYVSPTEITAALGDAPSVGGTAELEVVVAGGGDVNTFYLDLAHLSFGDQALFSFHPDDLSPDRGVPPVAANGSNQGGTIPPPPLPGPDDGDGRTRCVWENEMVAVTDGMGSIFQVRASDLKGGEYIIYQKEITQIRFLRHGVADVYETVTENGFRAVTSDTHKYETFVGDKVGTAVAQLKKGDSILTSVDGQDAMTVIKSKTLIEKDAVVIKFHLAPRHRFLIGRWDEGVCRKWGGICSKNRKADDTILVN